MTQNRRSSTNNDYSKGTKQLQSLKTITETENDNKEAKRKSNKHHSHSKRKTKEIQSNKQPVCSHVQLSAATVQLGHSVDSAFLFVCLFLAQVYRHARVFFIYCTNSAAVWDSNISHCMICIYIILGPDVRNVQTVH